MVVELPARSAGMMPSQSWVTNSHFDFISSQMLWRIFDVEADKTAIGVKVVKAGGALGADDDFLHAPWLGGLGSKRPSTK